MAPDMASGAPVDSPWLLSDTRQKVFVQLQLEANLNGELSKKVKAEKQRRYLNR